MEIVIRPITENDVAAYHKVVDVVAREKKYLAFVEAPPIETTCDYVRGIIKNRHTHYVADDAGQVIGWCDIIPDTFRTTHAHIGNLGIGLLPAYRGKGIGGRLMRTALEDAFAKGLTRIALTVLAGNHNAIALYGRMGFVHEGKHKCASRIDGAYEDTYSMALLHQGLKH